VSIMHNLCLVSIMHVVCLRLDLFRRGADLATRLVMVGSTMN
jgi:hypothetical protein